MSRYVSIIVLVDTESDGDGPEERLHLSGDTVGEVVYAAVFDGADPAFLWADGMAAAHSEDCARAIADHEARCAECGGVGAIPAANPEEEQDNGHAPCPECNGQRVTWQNDLAYVCGECEGGGTA